jgi:hypothetical protein
MSQSPLQTGSLALEANAATAGLALACAYSSSDQYEAEVIAVRRKAGAYATPHYRPALLALAVAAAAAAAALAIALAG